MFTDLAHGQPHRVPEPQLSRPTGATLFDAVLFDRDGTLIIDVPYNGDPSRVEPVPGARAALDRLRAAGLRLAVVSDIHVDVRPAFAAASLAGVVDVFTLSFELGAQKPDPRVFTATLDALGVQPHEALMVGDRCRPDGGAVECGVPTLLLPPLTAPDDRRLHHVLALCGA